VGWASSQPDGQPELLLKVTAAPDGGKANEAVIRLLAAHFDIPKTAVRLIRGQTSRHKTMALEIDEESYQNALRNHH
jgi:uncharacterized protein YggU (UPF0235/DUF167 family)